MRKEDEHVRERDAFARLERNTSFMVETVVEILPPFDGSAIEAGENCFRLVEVIPFDDPLGRRVPALRVLRDGHDSRNAELSRVDLDLEDAAQPLK